MIEKKTSTCSQSGDKMTVEMKHEKFRQEVLSDRFFQTVSSLSAFFSWLKDQQSRVVSINAKLSEENQLALFFRGVPNHEYRNIPSINRGDFYKHEDSIFNECLIRTPSDFAQDNTTFEKLVRMQHYGIPTRLLDLTSNPLVALFFACYSRNNENSGVNGKVCVFYVSRKAIKYPDSDTISVVANLARCSDSETDTSSGIYDLCQYYLSGKSGLPDSGGETLAAYEKAMKSFNSSPSILRLISFVRKEKPTFEPRILRETLESVWAVKPLLSNARIARQDGLFLIFGVNGHKENEARIPTVDFAERFLEIRKKFVGMVLLGHVIASDKAEISQFLKDSHFSEKCIDDVFKKVVVDDRHFDKTSKEVLMRMDEHESRKKQIEMALKFDFAERKASLFHLWLKYAPLQKGLLSMRRGGGKIAKDIAQHIKPLMFKYDVDGYLLHIQKLALDILCDQPLIFFDGVDVGNKKKVLADIEPIGMTYDKLFPELDDVAEYLKEKYKKNDAAEKV